MANWFTLTEDDVRLLDTEKTLMESIAPLQDLASCVLSSSNFARGYVAGGGNPLEPAPAVPPECVDDVIAIARATYLAQDPSGTLLTEIRQKERDNAIAHLRDIAKGVVTVTSADLATPTGQFGKWGGETKIDMRTHQP